MSPRQERQGWLLKLRWTEGALLGAPRWEDCPEIRSRGVALIALDLSAAEFVSTVFLQSCVEFSQDAAQRHQKVVLQGLSAHVRGLLASVAGAECLTVVGSDEELAERASSMVSEGGSCCASEGVSSAEKVVLWKK